MATYFWRKNGKLGTSSVLHDVDYKFNILKTKYGICALKVLLGKNKNFFKNYQKLYPLFNPFFIKKKTLYYNNLFINYFLIKLNRFFFFRIFKNYYIKFNTFSKQFFISLFKNILYNYIYLNVFLKNLLFKKFNLYLKNKFNRLFLPHYLNYKIQFNFYNLLGNYENFYIIPIINLKYLKRLNIRSSYKLKYFDKIKYGLKLHKYKIFF